MDGARPDRAGAVRGAPFRGYGTTVRFYDARIDAWRSTWHGLVKGQVLPFIARRVGNEIVMEGTDAELGDLRWIISEIAPESVRWRHLASRDHGRTWTTRQEMRVRRKASPRP